MDTDDQVIYISSKIEAVDTSEYSEELTNCFSKVPKVMVPILKNAKSSLRKLENDLYAVPSLVDLVSSSIPDIALQAVLTDDQKKRLANGALRLMTKKDGSLMANLVNPETKKIVACIPLETVKLSPEITQAMSNFSTQMQLAQIAEQIQIVQSAVEDIRQGQESDRLAIAYSCQQKMLQAMTIVRPEYRARALLQITSDAEDTRNQLMLVQKANVSFVSEQPESFWGKMLSGAAAEKINSRICEIRESLCAINMVSLVEALAYQELGEPAAARESLSYYADFVHDTYFSKPNLVERLNSMDPSPENYWSKTLPEIKKKIEALACFERTSLLGGSNDETDL